MSSSARHQDDFESPVKVAEMKQDNLKDYKRWKKESGVLQEALDEVKQCAVLQHKSLILKSLKNTLNEHEKWISDQISSWHDNGVCPDKVKGFT